MRLYVPHALATHLYQPDGYQTWLGHKSLAVTQLYLADSEHIDPGMQAKLDKAGAY
jgi:integrase